MPLLQEELPLLHNNLTDLGELVPAETPHVSHRDGIEPELRVPPSMRDMDVRWFASFHAEEEEAIRTNP